MEQSSESSTTTNYTLPHNTTLKHVCKLSIVEDIKSEIIDTTSTATKYKVGHSVSYELISVIKNCTVLERKLINSSNFDSKSSGYSFGSDVSKTVTVEKNLQTNFKM